MKYYIYCNMKYSILLSILLITSGCSPLSKESKESKKESTNQITLIFKNPVQNGIYEIPGSNGITQSRNENGDEIQFLDDNLIEQQLNLDFEAQSDTVVINTTRDVVEIRLMYKGVNDLKYLLQNGDSVIFSYSGIKPIAEVINRKEDYAVTNFSLLERDSLSIDEYTALEIIQKPILLYFQNRNSKGLDYKNLNANILKSALDNLPIELANNYAQLESLKDEGRISNKQFEYRLQNIYFQLAEATISTKLKTMAEIEKASVLKRTLDEFIERYPKVQVQRKDSLIFNNAYTNYLLLTTSLEIRKKVNFYNYNTGQSGGNILNYPEAYDSIQSSTNLSLIEKKRVQFGYITQLFQDAGFFRIETRWEYLNKFKNDCQDSTMIDFIVKKFNIKFTIDNDLELVNKIGEITSLEELIRANTGKVIYVDFWASWCAPCIKEIPYSKQLQKDLASKNIVYVYLSSDRTDKLWQKALQKHELIEGLNYRIDNAGYSTKMQELNIPSIPRYMIYDTKGQLVNNNAPRPSEIKALKAELMKYIETSR